MEFADKGAGEAGLRRIEGAEPRRVTLVERLYRRDEAAGFIDRSPQLERVNAKKVADEVITKLRRLGSAVSLIELDRDITFSVVAKGAVRQIS